MEIQVLGPLRVEEHGQALPLGGPKQRTLLAILVAHGGASLTMDSLLMGVYGPDADPKKRRTLHTYISRYRAALGEVIGRQGDGYALLAAPSHVDATQFTSSVARAKRLIDPADSAAVLRNALDMWRGPAYADVECDAIAAEARRLEEVRSAALEDRIGLDLAAGRHRQLVPELETLVAEAPHRERLRAHQMVALYRCGRQADALRAYRAAGDYLREELGLDPSAELQDLELEILNHDAGLDYQPQPRRQTLPARFTSFIGRESEVEHARSAVAEHRLVTITGPGGIGKSSLATEVARSFCDELATIYVPIEAERQVPPAVLIATSLGITPDDESAAVDVIADAIGDTPTLLVVDGCEHVLDQLPRLLVDLLRRCPQLRLVVTSREALSMTGEYRIALGPLPVGPGSWASRLFTERAGIRPADVGQGMSAQVDRIATRLSGLPLAVELAASRHPTLSVEEIAAKLDDLSSLLTTKRGPDDRHLTMESALDWSYGLLTPELRSAFRRLSVFDTGMIHPVGAASVLAVEDATALIHGLIDVSLVSAPDERGRYRMLEPIRQYAAHQLDASGERFDAEQRLATWLVQVASEIRHLYYMGHTAEALPRLRDHAPALASASRWALEHEEIDTVFNIVGEIGRIWPLVADPTVLREPANAALEQSDGPLSNVAIRALAHTAFLYSLDEPEVTLAVRDRLDQQIPDVNDVKTLQVALSARAVLESRKGSLHHHPERAARALAWNDRSIELLAEMGYPPEPNLRNRALFLAEVGRFEEAETTVRRQAEWAGVEHPGVRGLALEYLAEFQAHRGELELALHTCREASRLLIDAGNFDIAAEAEYRRAWIHSAMEDFADAAAAVRRGDELHRLIGLPPAQVEEPQLVAIVMAGLERWDQFVAATEAYFEVSPQPGDGGDYEDFLLGDPATGSHFLVLIAPTARWLMRQGRSATAARLVAAAPIGFRKTEFGAWEELGEVARVERVAQTIPVQPVSEVPATLDELYRFVTECVRADTGSP